MILKIIFISGFVLYICFTCFTLWAIIREGDFDEDE
jgi:hypothetical protein